MTKNGTKDARIQYRDEVAKKGNFIDLQAYAQGISILLTAGLTVLLSWKEQYVYSLCSACLALAATTSDRLKRVKLSRQGFLAEWESLRRPRRAAP